MVDISVRINYNTFKLIISVFIIGLFSDSSVATTYLEDNFDGQTHGERPANWYDIVDATWDWNFFRIGTGIDAECLHVTDSQYGSGIEGKRSLSQDTGFASIKFDFMGDWHASYNDEAILAFKDSSGNTLFYFQYRSDSGWGYWKFNVFGATSYYHDTSFAKLECISLKFEYDASLHTVNIYVNDSYVGSISSNDVSGDDKISYLHIYTPSSKMSVARFDNFLITDLYLSHTIQEEINQANTGSTIYIPSGIYNESIVVNKSINLVSSGSTTPIINGTDGKPVINITADNVNISGFEIQNGMYGIYLNGKETTIKNCYIYGSESGTDIFVNTNENSSLFNCNFSTTGFNSLSTGNLLVFWDLNVYVTSLYTHSPISGALVNVTDVETGIEFYSGYTDANGLKRFEVAAYYENSTGRYNYTTDYMYNISLMFCNEFNSTLSKINFTTSVELKTSGSLVLHLPFDEGTGSIAYDSSGNENHGTLYNGPTWTNGILDGALEFDGLDDYITVESSLSSHIKNSITVSAWVNSNSLSQSSTFRAIVTEAYTGDANVEFSLFLHGDNHSLNTGFYDGTWRQISETTPFPLNQWVHVAATYDGHFIRVYRDGTQVAISSDLNRNLPSGTNGWRIGRRHDSGGASDMWYGKIDDVRVYNRALSQSEIKLLSYKLQVPEDFLSIQEAINSALVGTTIYVNTGIYNESIVVNKSINLVSSGSTTPIINGTDGKPVINITADNVNISGFKIQNGMYGIYLNGKEATIKNCYIYGSESGTDIFVNTNENTSLINCNFSTTGFNSLSTGNLLVFWDLNVYVTSLYTHSAISGALVNVTDVETGIEFYSGYTDANGLKRFEVAAYYENSTGRYNYTTDYMYNISVMFFNECNSTFSKINFTTSVELRIIEYEIKIITPENKVYTDPMSGYYPATYGFENDRIGDAPSGWYFERVPQNGQVTIIDFLDGHRNVMKIEDTNAEGWNGVDAKQNFSSPQSSGTIEFWWRTNEDSNVFQYIRIIDSSNEGSIAIIHENGKLKRYEGDAGDPQTLFDTGFDFVKDRWYHFKIKFDIGSAGDGSNNWHLWRDGVSIDGGSGFGWSRPQSVDPVALDILWINPSIQATNLYIDAFGYSWDPNYNIGDNLNCNSN